MTEPDDDPAAGEEPRRDPDADRILLEAADDFAQRYRRGEHPGVEEFAARFPAVADRIRALFPAMIEIERSARQGSADPADGIGRVVGRYRIIRRVGEGGFGVVFLAEQLDPVRRMVALKVIKPGLDTRQVIARFEAERQALAMMEHENIARVYDAGATESGRPYFVMELVDGVPITEYCARHGLPPRDRLALFDPVCRAVHHAHAKGIVHRDLKPTNVLVATVDGRPVPKVIDFGVAKAIDRPLDEDTLFTTFAQLVGTPLYMSPEQADPAVREVDARSDVYSLGVLLYELLTGTTPLEREKLKRAALEEVRRLIREHEPPAPSERLSKQGKTAAGPAPREVELHGPRSIRGDLDWIVMKCLEKDRARRYETAGALSEDIARYLADRPVAARPHTRGYRLRKWAGRHRRKVAAACLVVATGCAGAGVMTWRAVSASRQAAAAVDRRTRARVRLYEAARTVPSRVSGLTEAQRHDEARDLYQQFLSMASDAYAPWELDMVFYRLKYATLVGNAGDFARAERLIREAADDARAHGTFTPWVEYSVCERLAFLFAISAQLERSHAPAQRAAELARQLSFTPYTRPPVLRPPASGPADATGAVPANDVGDAAGRGDRARARTRLYEAARSVPTEVSRLTEAQRHDEAAALFEQLVSLAGEVYAPWELDMVFYRLKYATLVGNAGRHAVAERLIREAVADAKSHGSYGPYVEYGEVERLAFLYELAGDAEKARPLVKRAEELSRELNIRRFDRPPVRRPPGGAGVSESRRPQSLP